MSPPRYTHRQLILSVQVLGAKAVLETLLDELMSHVSAGADAEPVALEVVAVMVSAPQAQSPDLGLPRRQLSLRDALQAEVDDVFEGSKRDAGRAAVVVRLHRRVEALVGSQVHGDGDAAVIDEAMTGNVLQQGEGLPAEDIDDVLGQANEQAAAMDLFGGAGDFMNLT